MKNIHLLFLALALLCGCSSFEEQNTLPSLQSADELRAGFADNTTKTYIENGKYLRWHADDRLTAFFGNTLNRQYRFKGETGDNSGTFALVPNGELGAGNSLDAIYALYPYSESAKISDEGIISLTLPTTQSYAENSFGRGANTMVAVTENVEDTYLAFKNVCGYLKLKLYGNATIKSIEVVGNNNEKIAGAATTAITFGGAPVTTMAATATTSVTLDCGEGITLGTTADTATEFWIVLPETTFTKGLTIKVTDTDGGIFEKSTDNEVTITRNEILPMAAVEVICEISIPNNQIWYTATEKVEPSTSTTAFGANIISNEWDETTGEGVITFDGEVTSVSFYNKPSLTSISMPNSVTRVSSIKLCPNLKELTLPKSIVNMSEAAFYESTGVITINCNIPDSSYSRSDNHDWKDPIFYKAEFSEAIIGEGVTSLGRYSLSFCSKLVKVYCKPTTPPTLGSSSFIESGGIRIFVPFVALETYMSAAGWKNFADCMVGYDFEKNEIVGALPQNPITYDWYTSATNNIYEIDTPEELVALSKLSNGDSVALATVGADAAITFEGATINLTKDIDLSAYCSKLAGNWIPIKSFYGTFNGNNHTISNLFCNTTGSTGLFLSVAGATIKDLIVSGELICSAAKYVGGIAGSASDSLFENCISHVNITTSTTSSGTCVAGICGNSSSSKYIACQSTGNIYDTIVEWEWYNYVGGILGYDLSGYNILVACCKLKGRVVECTSQSYTGVGGMVGYIMGGTVQSCYTSINLGGRNPGHIANIGYRENYYSCRNIAYCYYSSSASDRWKGIGTNNYSGNYESFDYGTTNSTDIAAEIIIMNEGIDKWNTEHQDCICNYKYELDADGVPALVKQTQN